MPSTQKFDGPVLADLLDRVAALGPGAKVVRAEKKRDGGLVGFFSKEWFELTVSVPTKAEREAAARAAAQAAQVTPKASENVGAALARRPAPQPAAPAPTSVLEMAEAVSEAERHETFHDVLQRVADDTGLITGGPQIAEEFLAAAKARLAGLPPAEAPTIEPSVAPAPVPLTPSLLAGAVPATFPKVERPIVEVPSAEVEDARAFVAAATSGLDPARVAMLVFGDDLLDDVPAPSTAAVVGSALPFTAAIEDVARRAEVPEPQPVIARVRERAVPYVPATESHSFNSVLQRLADQSELALGNIEAARSASMTTRDLVPALEALGVPRDLLPAHALRDVPTLALPAAPSLPPALGAIIAVVGTRLAARRLARLFARDLGRDDDGIVLANPTGASDVRTPSDLEGAREAWRRPWVSGTVIAVGIPPGGRHTGWGRDLIDALDPDLVFGVVDADRKCDDVATWAHELGGLDALALERLDATVSPASLLSLGIPVARLDGRPATPDAWAEVLTRRLGVAA